MSTPITVGVRMHDNTIARYKVSTDSWEEARNAVIHALTESRELPQAVLTLVPRPHQ